MVFEAKIIKGTVSGALQNLKLLKNIFLDSISLTEIILCLDLLTSSSKMMNA